MIALKISPAIPARMIIRMTLKLKTRSERKPMTAMIISNGPLRIFLPNWMADSRIRAQTPARTPLKTLIMAGVLKKFVRQ